MNEASFWRDTVKALRFYSRLPLPALAGEGDPHAVPDLARMAEVVPAVGAILGGLAGLVLVGASWFWPPTVAALVAVAAGLVITGAFHEDGLADTADSFGGTTAQKRLEIMRDSRIGTFGAAALVLALLLRAAALASLLAAAGAGRTALAMAAAGALSRTAALAAAVRLAPARPDGAAHAAGRPADEAWRRACLLALASAALLLPTGGLFGAAAAVVAVAAIGRGAVGFAERHVGGHTGDIAGATQQVCEIAVLLALLVFV